MMLLIIIGIIALFNHRHAMVQPMPSNSPSESRRALMYGDSIPPYMVY